jgi:hypothetical protein
VGEHDGVVVDVDDAGFRRDGLGDLVDVGGGGDAGADIEELPDPGLGGEVVHNPAEERTVGSHGEGQLRVDLQPGVDGGPVGREVVPAAEQVITHWASNHTRVTKRVPGSTRQGFNISQA